MNAIKPLLFLAFALLAPAVFGSTIVSSDITTDTTWNAAGSPYKLNGTTIKVRNGATLTIDSSSGNVEVWSRALLTYSDFQIGNGSGDEGFLHIVPLPEMFVSGIE